MFASTFSAVRGNALDSLLTLLKTAHDTDRIHLVILISDEYRFTDLDKAIQYGHLGVELAEKENYVVLMMEAYNYLGNAYRDKGNYDLGLIYLHKAEKLAKEENNLMWRSKSCNNLGNIYGEKGDDEMSLKYYIEGYKFAEQIGDYDAMVVTGGNVGAVYLSRKQPVPALQYFRQSLNSISKIKTEANKFRVQFAMWLNIGACHFDLDNMDSALFYFQKTLELAEKNKNASKIASAKEQIACVHMKRGNLTEAIQLFEEVLKIFRELDHKPKIQDMLVYMGEAYFRAGDYNKAAAIYEEALTLSKEMGINSYTFEIYDGISKVAEKQNDFKKAYLFSRNAIRFKDSIKRDEDIRLLAEMQTRFETEKKQKEIELLNEKDRNNKIIIWAVGIGLVLVLIGGIFFFNAYHNKRKAALLLERQKNEIERQKHIIEEKNKDITDSISYAERIQSALLTSDMYLQKHFGESFVLFRPRDIVSGDFYWGYEKDGNFFFAAADSTGHGVPGAFMSMIGVSLLNEIIIERKISNPALILDILREEIIHRLNPEGRSERKDGMDMVLIRYDKTARELDYAAANNSFYIIRNGKLLVQPADKMPVGAHSGINAGFTRHRLTMEKEDMIYLFTDGFADQFGGANGKKFKYRQLEQTLLAISGFSCEEQKNKLDRVFTDWKGPLEQVDDVLLAGFRIS
ncbi:MAG: tetratricopeptide repeat protein [Bacteroidia bacterium]|nr:tetratricopeptide repeat protein [Bacteroidia bacterium]